MQRFIERFFEADKEAEVNALQTALRLLLGAALTYAGLSHLFWSRSEFLAQVPNWVPIEADLVVVLSGVVEILIGLALLVAWRYRAVVGIVAAAFFVLVFPGNIAQLVEGTDAFGLDSDTARAVRLAFQPVLVAWALWSTGAWSALRSLRNVEEVGGG